MKMRSVFTLLLHPVRFTQEYIDDWILRRVRRQAGPIAVPRNRVYIVPTRYGYGFAFIVFLMLLAATNYSNSMGFLLAFLLAGIGLVAMHHTHANLVNVQVRAGRTQPVFAGDVVHYEIFVDNPSAKPRYGIAACWPRRSDVATHGDVPPQSDVALVLRLPAPQRGWLPARVFSVETEFPVGLFHAWTWMELDMACLVYPRPAPAGLPPPASSGGGGYNSGARTGQDEFAGLRGYQRGDSPRHIHWKSLPKDPQPMVKQFTETLEQELWLEWDALPHLELEPRLSQLTRWALDAEAAGRVYGLRIPGTRIGPGRGEAHQYQVLKALALYGSGT